MRTDNCQPCTG